MLIIKLYSIMFLFFLFSCKRDDKKKVPNHKIILISKKDFSEIFYIKTKFTLINDEGSVVSDNRYYKLADKKIPIENLTKFDSLGNTTEFQKGGSEGFVIYQKDYIKNRTLPLEKDMFTHIIIDKKRNYIIGNKDTIKNFYLSKGKKIQTQIDKNNRFIVYEY